MATSSEMKGVGLGQQFASKQLNGQMQCHGIGRKLINLVQYISWIKVRNISIYLVATRTSTAYYDKLGFSSYPRDNKQLPPLLQTCLESENIVLNEKIKIYPKYLKDKLLVTGPVPASKLLKEYFYAQIFINETTNFTDQERNNLKITE